MVKFGKYLKAHQDADWAAHYIDYALLKKQIKHLSSVKEQMHNSDPSKVRGHFMGLLNEELNKVEQFSVTSCEQLYDRISFLWRKASKLFLSLKNSEEQVKTSENSAELYNLRQSVEKGGEAMCKLFNFIELNATAVRKITKKWDKKIKDTFLTGWYGLHEKDENSFLKVKKKINGLLVTVSKIYVLLRKIDHLMLAENSKDGKKDAEGSKWKPPESFERETTKYWVQYTDLLRIKLAIMKHLPLLIFGEDDNAAIKPSKSGADENVWFESDALLARRESMTKIKRESDSALITSVYFDSDDFYSYDSRIRRREGAELIRMR